MLAKAATVSNARKHEKHETGGKSAEEQQKDREMFLADSDTYKNFWIGVQSASIIQKEKLVRNAKKTKFKRNHGPKMPIVGDKIYAEHSKELLQHSNLFDPEGVRKMLWDCFVGLLILYSVLIIPYRIGFQVDPTSGEFIFDSIVDCLFFIDIIASFNTSYIDTATEITVTDRKLIAINYLKLWFWIDLFSTIPIDTIINEAMGTNGSELSSLRLIKILRLTRMLKLLRVLKLSKFGKLLESYNLNPALLGVQKLVMQICFVAHIVSCFWHFLATDDVRVAVDDWDEDGPDPNGRTWVSKFGYTTASIGTRYVAAFYWTISTMLSIGYGDISGTNKSERIYCIATQLVGAVLFGAVIAQVTRLIESRNPQARAFKEKMDELKAYLNEKLLPSKLKMTAKEAYGYFLARKSSFGERGIYNDLPPNLLNKLVLSIYSSEVHRILMFKKCDENFVVKLITNSKPFQALPGTMIVEKGDVPDELMFIMRGLVQFTTVGYTENDGVVDAVTGYSTEGGYFGDFEYYKRTIRMVSHRAMCNCSLLSVPTNALDECINSFPLSGEKIHKEFEQRYENYLIATQSAALKKEGHRVYVKEQLVVDGMLQSMHDGDTSQLYAKRINSSTNQVLEVYRTVKLVEKAGQMTEVIVEEHYEDLLRRYILLPKSENKIKWDLFIGILIIFSVILIPVQIGFARKSSGGLAVFDYVVDAFFVIDMIASMRTCYFDDEHDAYVVIPRKMYQHYFVTWFWIDFFSVMPFEPIMAQVTGGSASIFSSLKLLKVIRLMRLLKLARLAKLRKYIARLEDTLGINPATFELVKMMLEVVFIGHLTACLYWYLSATLSSRAWFDKLDLRDASLSEQYVASVYWTFTTLSTVGYGDIVPVDTEGRMVVIVVMILGATVFGYIVANVSSLMGSLDVTSTRMNERIAEVTEYLIEKNAPAPLSDAIVKHIKYMFTQSSAFDERAILARLPLHISRKMIFFQHAETLSKIAIFKYIQSRGVILYLFRLMTPVFYDALQYICIEGAMAHDMTFLVSGRANVYKAKINRAPSIRSRSRVRDSRPTPSQPVKVAPIEMCDLITQLTAGDFFGHVSIMNRKPYQASVRTFMPCSVYTLSEVEITRLLRNFPAVALNLQSALAMAVHARQDFGRQFLRSKRAEFISSCGTAFVQARAKMMVDRVKSQNLLSSLIPRMNSNDDFGSTDGNSKGDATAGRKRRGSLTLMVGGSAKNLLGGGSTSPPKPTHSEKSSKYEEKDDGPPETRNHHKVVPLETVLSESRLGTNQDTLPVRKKPPPMKSAQSNLQIETEKDKKARAANSKWNIVRAVVHDPASMAIIESQNAKKEEESAPPPVIKKTITKQLSSLGANKLDKPMLRGMSIKSLGSFDRKQSGINLPPPSRSQSIAEVVKKSMNNKKRAKVAFLTDGSEWYDSEDDKKVYDEFYLLKSRALFKRNRSCPNFSDHIFKKKVDVKRKRRMTFPMSDVDDWKEEQQSQCYL